MKLEVKKLKALEAALLLCLDQTGEDGNPFELIPEIVARVLPNVHLDAGGRLSESAREKAKAAIRVWEKSR